MTCSAEYKGNLLNFLTASTLLAVHNKLPLHIKTQYNTN